MEHLFNQLLIKFSNVFSYFLTFLSHKEKYSCEELCQMIYILLLTLKDFPELGRLPKPQPRGRGRHLSSAFVHVARVRGDAGI